MTWGGEKPSTRGVVVRCAYHGLRGEVCGQLLLVESQPADGGLAVFWSRIVGISYPQETVVIHSYWQVIHKWRRSRGANPFPVKAFPDGKHVSTQLVILLNAYRDLLATV